MILPPFLLVHPFPNPTAQSFQGRESTSAATTCPRPAQACVIGLLPPGPVSREPLPLKQQPQYIGSRPEHSPSDPPEPRIAMAHRLDLVCRCQLTTPPVHVCNISPCGVLTTAFYPPLALSSLAQISKTFAPQIKQEHLERCWCTPSLPSTHNASLPTTSNAFKGGEGHQRCSAPARHRHAWSRLVCLLSRARLRTLLTTPSPPTATLHQAQQ